MAVLRFASPQLTDHISGTTATICICILITRRDGFQIGFTTLDSDITFSAQLYESIGSADSSSLKQTSDTGVDNLEVLGLLDSQRITEDDLIAGRYDSAKLEFFIINYRDLSMGKMDLITGIFGEVTLKDGGYVAELRSQTQYLKQYISNPTAPTCRIRRFGNAQCKIDATLFQQTGVITAVSADQLTLSITVGTSKVDDYYDYGLITITSSTPNQDLMREVKYSLGGSIHQTIVLREAFPFDVLNGDTVLLEAGCDRTFPTCKNKFSNTVNFHGEPFLPGNDKVIQIGRPPR